MWLTPRDTASRSTATAASRSFGGPKMPGPASRMAPYPIRVTVRSPIVNVPADSALPATRTPFHGDRQGRLPYGNHVPPRLGDYRASAQRAAWYPPKPWTAAPGGVAAEQR